MMASTLADNVSMRAAPLAANLSRNPLRLRAQTPMIASGYTYKQITQVLESAHASLASRGRHP